MRHLTCVNLDFRMAEGQLDPMVSLRGVINTLAGNPCLKGGNPISY